MDKHTGLWQNIIYEGFTAGKLTYPQCAAIMANCKLEQEDVVAAVVERDADAAPEKGIGEIN